MGIFNSYFPFIDKKSKISELQKGLKTFKCGAKAYKKKYKKPPVIIYDNVNQISNDDSKLLNIFQDDAKKNADNRGYIAIFISNEDSILKRMECEYDIIFYSFI